MLNKFELMKTILPDGTIINHINEKSFNYETIDKYTKEKKRLAVIPQIGTRLLELGNPPNEHFQTITRIDPQSNETLSFLFNKNLTEPIVIRQSFAFEHFNGSLDSELITEKEITALITRDQDNVQLILADILYTDGSHLVQLSYVGGGESGKISFDPENYNTQDAYTKLMTRYYLDTFEIPKNIKNNVIFNAPRTNSSSVII